MLNGAGCELSMTHERTDASEWLAETVAIDFTLKQSSNLHMTSGALCLSVTT